MHGAFHSERMMIMIFGMKRNIYHKAVMLLSVSLSVTVISLLSGCTPKHDELIIEAETLTQSSSSDISCTGDDVSPHKDDVRSKETAETENVKTETVTEDVFVHVCGAVQRPGVYVLRKSGHVCDAVSAAGGFSDEADQEYVNQAYPVSDGMKIVIPTVQEASDAVNGCGTDGRSADSSSGTSKMTEGAISMSPDSSGGQAEGIGIGQAEMSSEGGAEAQVQADDGKIDINSADESGLCMIPVVGTKRAADIIAYRTEHGQFNSIEDIMNVSGIKQGTFDKIKDSIKVR